MQDTFSPVVGFYDDDDDKIKGILWTVLKITAFWDIEV
jgi:hypothetical protein